MTRVWVGCLGIVLALVGSRAAGRADVVVTKSGGKIEGEVTRDLKDEETIEVKTKFGRVVLPREDVKEIRSDREGKEEYQKRAKEAKETAEGQYELALWCLEAGLKEEYRRHLERVIELDPEHGEVRKRLGYERKEGKWITEDEARAAEGMVKYRGKWMLPQERAREEAKREGEDRKKELARVIRTAQRGLRSTGREGRRAEAREELLAIQDEAAVPILVAMLGKKGTEEERGILVEVLDGIEGEASAEGMIEVALEDEASENRQRAGEGLVKRKSVALVARMARELASKENRRVNRSAVVLGLMGDDSVAPALVDALVTTHKRVIEPTMADVESALAGQPVKTSETVILPDGTIVRRNLIEGMTADQAFGTKFPQRRVIVEEKQNTDVLLALETLTGENFGFSEEAWRGWLKRSYRDDAAGRDE